MRYRPLAGFEVSVFGLGAANFGGVGSSRKLVGKGDTEAEAHALLDCAVALGINLIDTAGTYGAGASEEIIGSWLRSRGSAARDKVVLCSKVGIRGGLGRENIVQEVDRTLARFGRETIDLYMTHVPDPATPWEDVRSTFQELVRAGKIRRFGLSNVGVTDLAECAPIVSDGRPSFEWVQNKLNLLERDDEHNGVVDACRWLGLKYTAYSPLAGGLLSGKYVLAGQIPGDTRLGLRADLYGKAWTPANAARVEVLKREAAARSVSPAGLAAWWVLHGGLVTSVLIGPRRPEQLERMVLEALSLPEDPELWRSLGGLELREEGACNTERA